MGLIGLHTFTSNMTKMSIPRVPNFTIKLKTKEFGHFVGQLAWSKYLISIESLNFYKSAVVMNYWGKLYT